MSKFVLLSEENLNLLLDRLDSIEKKLPCNSYVSADRWIDNEEFIHSLKISKRTAQNYRDRGLIAFSQIGSKIYYSTSDIETFLNQHHIKSFENSTKTIRGGER